MKPVSPIIPRESLPITVYAQNQPEYKPLPVWKDRDGAVLSRWRLSWRERLRVLFSGNVYLWTLTFNRPLQPVMLQVDKPQVTQRLAPCRTSDEEAAVINTYARKAEARG